MAATTISRATWTDGASGTLLNNARLQADVYDKIDSLIASTITFGGLVHSEGFGTHLFSTGGTGSNIFRVRNTTGGTTNKGVLQVMGDGADITSLEHHSTTFTTSGSAIANAGRLNCSAGAGLSINGATIRLYDSDTLIATCESTDGLRFENTFGVRIKNSAGTTVDGVVVTGSNAMNIGSDNAAVMGDTNLKAGAAIHFHTNSADRGSINNSGIMQITAGYRKPIFKDRITPSALAAGDTHNYAPTGFADAAWIQINGGGSGAALTGIDGGVDGKILIVTNVDISGSTITLKHNNGASLSANRIFGGGVDTVLGASQSAILMHDGSSWYVASEA